MGPGSQTESDTIPPWTERHAGVNHYLPATSLAGAESDVHLLLLATIFTARKRSLRRLCFYRCLSVHRGGVYVTWLGRRAWWHGGTCVVAGGGCEWWWGGVGHAWWWGGGMRGGRGLCVVVGGIRAWWWEGGPWDTTRYGQWAGSTYPTGMHSCKI